MTMKKMDVPAGEFKAKCLQLMDEVARTRESITITKRGKPVARLVPPPTEQLASKPLFGFMAGTVSLEGDIVAPPDPKWVVMARGSDKLFAPARAPAKRLTGRGSVRKGRSSK